MGDFLTEMADFSDEVAIVVLYLFICSNLDDYRLDGHLLL
jgi:hypothetical protein